MRIADWVNALAVIMALGCALGAVALVGGSGAHATPVARAEDAPAILTEILLDDGRRAVRDARGTAIPLRPYQRIVSLSLISDALLLELCEPQRVVAFSTYTHGADAFRLGAVPRIKGLDDVEQILALHPDLVFCTPSRGELDRVARLASAGVTVCDLGDEGGLSTLEHAAHLSGRILGTSTRAAELCRTLDWRMANLAARLPPGHAHRRALVVLMVADSFYGGTVGTSYHDVLTAAGLTDVAASVYKGWPAYHLEDLIALNPEVIVTATGSGERLRRLPALASMPALHQPGGIIEVDDNLLSDPGPHMLDAAEAVFKAAYP